MCGRFTSLLTPELLAVIYGVMAPPVLEPRYNIAPTTQILVVRNSQAAARETAWLRWGLIPSWARDSSIGARMINARSETVHEKPAFRQALQTRRCIIPASGFYEWAGAGASKAPHYITARDGTPLSFAGIWEQWSPPDGTSLQSVAILTTQANQLMAPIHDRMPVLLSPADLPIWLDSSIRDPLRLQQLYQPYPAELLQEWQVATLVNNPKNNTDACIQPIQ